MLRLLGCDNAPNLHRPACIITINLHHPQYDRCQTYIHNHFCIVVQLLVESPLAYTTDADTCSAAVDADLSMRRAVAECHMSYG